MSRVEVTQASVPLSDGILQTDLPLDGTPQIVKDQLGNSSKLLLATDETQVNSVLRVKTDNSELLDLEDNGSNNRFNINRDVQKINLDFASKPSDITTQVGAIRTAQDGVNLSDAVKFQENGQVTFTERVKLEADSTVTTQTSSVIQSTTTNANLVISPNGTGAIIASVPDGTATGGNARGNYAVDLQTSRTNANQVASGDGSFVVGQNNRAANAGSIVAGRSNTSTSDDGVVFGTTNSTTNASQSSILGGYLNTISVTRSTIAGGQSNNITAANCFIGGGNSNTASSQLSVVSGGASNTASTNTHATVVGGQSNTSSGQWSVSGGSGAVASGSLSIAFNGSSSAIRAISIGSNCSSNQDSAVAIGYQNTASGKYANAFGIGAQAYLQGMQTYSSIGGFVGNGEAQSSVLVPIKSATLTTAATTVLSLDGTGTTNLIIPNGNNRMWNVQVAWVAVVTAITGTATGVTVGDTKTSTDLLAVAKRGGVTTVSAHTSAGTHAIETLAGSLTAANITYSAGASQEMAITFTGPTFAGGGSVTMRVVARVQLTEVAY